MKKNKIIGIPIDFISKNDILEKINKYLDEPVGFFHIVSINPEIVVEASRNESFRIVLSEGDLQICDGVGTQLGCAILGIPVPERIAGVDLMADILKIATSKSLRVLLIGGKGKVANDIAKCYQADHPTIICKGIEGYEDVNYQKKAENEYVLHTIAEFNPHIVLVAYGSPAQELWLYNNQKVLSNKLCMGVGGGFDFMSGNIARAPVWVRQIGAEWLYRLVAEPWRWRRQLKLFTFVRLVLQQKLLQ